MVDDLKNAAPWTELDSLAVAELQAFSLAFDADSEIWATMIDAKAAAVFDQATDPALVARKGLGADLQILAPLDATYTVSGWTGMNGDTSRASNDTEGRDGNFLALLEADRKTVIDLGNDHLLHPSRGSNNWIIGPNLSASGHTMLANDPHLGLGNPATFYLVHLAARSGPVPMNVMGASFPGIPGVIVGMNDHVAWGVTTSYIDVTDVYRESIVTCDDGVSPCVEFRGAKVKLVPRIEKFGIGLAGRLDQTVSVTLYDVPHHGPIIPRITANHDSVEPLGSSELSIRYTGHQSAQLLRASLGLGTAGSMKEAVAALDRDFKYGGQNWLIGDDQGHFGWTEIVRVPRRTAGHAPWKILPGDGSAEWGGDMDPKYIPHAYDPPQGFIATANNDPVGVTDDGDPFFGEPLVDGAPLYLGWYYDPGTRQGRITKRIAAMTANGKKLSVEDLQSIQADAVTEWGEALAPTLLDAANSLTKELASPGTYPELTTIATTASADVQSALPLVIPTLTNWTFDTPSGMAEDNPTPQEVSDSRATLLAASWIAYFRDATLSDELEKLESSTKTSFDLKLLVRACTHPELLRSGLDPITRDPVIFDDLRTPGTEGKREMASKALVASLDDLLKRLGPDPAAWRWGQVHTIALQFAVPVLASLQVPPVGDPKYVYGFPRHGHIGTVDVGDIVASTKDFAYADGPAMRFACELDPEKGPLAKNVLPGGETFDPASPHYSDQMELWRKNKTFDVAFQIADVLTSANEERAATELGRIRIAPSAR